MQKNHENQEPEIIIENPEIISTDSYHGTIVSLHQGYVFLNNVKRAYESISTNGDVFAPVPEQNDYQVGQTVQFNELNPDKERPGRFRTETISPLAIGKQGERVIAISQLAKTESPYHALKKAIDENDAKKAGENKPLFDFIQQIGYLLNQDQGYNPEHINRLAEDYVAKTFAMLGPLGVKCSIQDDVDKEAEAAMILETITMYQESGLQGQAESLDKEYKQFLAVRAGFSLMWRNNLLSYCSVMDMRHLPEITFAFPVWFVHGKSPLYDHTNEEDPQIDDAIKYFANCVGTKEYAWFYQIFNRRTRPLSHFRGKDIMPPALVKIMNEAKSTFDYVAILTPYHDIASREWSDPNWLRNIDPIMIGFIKGLPQMFVLGRWSGTGIFPLLLDCIADTANFIRLNKHLLKNFKNSTYWYKGNSLNNDCLSDDNNSNGLEEYADKLLAAYDAGCLFEFLRGETSGI